MPSTLADFKTLSCFSRSSGSTSSHFIFMTPNWHQQIMANKNEFD
jgi:hypothetical protein